MKIEDLYHLYIQNYLVDTDTRSIRKDSIYFSLKGANFNGNKFAKQAVEKGAKYCVIDEEEYEIEGVTILVDDALKTLQKLANYHRNRLAIPILGLTGSNGKTTTKELINAVLETEFKTTATKGNLNNHIGVPLTLLSFTNETEIGIVEMGANHQKEIEFLATICEPDFGYITNFGKAHLEGFGGIEGVIKGKSELYTYLKENNKTTFVNSNDPKQLELTEGFKRIFLNDSVTISTSESFLSIKYKNQIINTHLIGDYNLTNIVAAISIGEHFNISKQHIISAIENYTPKNNRSQHIQKKSNTLLMDAYNANPTSTELALKNFSKIEHTNKVVILGDMFELGEDAALEHQSIVDLCKTLRIDRCVFVGENYYKTSATEKYKNFESLKNQVTKEPILDSYVLIKGSRGMALERILDLIN
tara:strand:+ start:3114 stop:4367 length:1254 start_codon:yes stop_codon:yes gene_type:complete